MKNEKQQLGKAGEDAACQYLIGIGQTIIERNWRDGHLEIDIITTDRNGLHFVEVKSRKAPLTAAPEVNVNHSKQRNITHAAQRYLHSTDKKVDGALEIFFDVLTVVFDGDDIDISYFPQAYIPIYT